MKQGDIMVIYDDPITKQKPEGKAKLLKKIKSDFNQEYWKVEFLSDGFISGRWVATD